MTLFYHICSHVGCACRDWDQSGPSSWHPLAAPRHPECSPWQGPKPHPAASAELFSFGRAVFRAGFGAPVKGSALGRALLSGPWGLFFGNLRALALGAGHIPCEESSLLILFFLKRINGEAGAAFLGMHSPGRQLGNSREFLLLLFGIPAGGEAAHCSPPPGRAWSNQQQV